MDRDAYWALGRGPRRDPGRRRHGRPSDRWPRHSIGCRRHRPRDPDHLGRQPGREHAPVLPALGERKCDSRRHHLVRRIWQPQQPLRHGGLRRSGNLWIANLDAGTLVEYTPSQLASSGAPTPAITISSDGSSLSEPGSVAFDRSGDLWALNENGALEEFTPSQLASSGDPTPVVSIWDSRTRTGSPSTARVTCG